MDSPTLTWYAFRDMTPIILDRTNTKILESVSPKKAYQVKVGESIGLDIKFVMETESELVDRVTLLDTIRNYRYNPYVAALFTGTETALRSDGTPTIRYHKYTLVHNPQRSTTKQMKVDIKVSAATKEKSVIVKHVASQSTKKSKQEQKLTTCIEKLYSDRVYAANVLVEVSMIGGSPKTYEYSVTAAKGSSEQEHRWNLHVESESEPRMLCVSGHVRRESEKFTYKNQIGFGSNCAEYFVKMHGVAVTSEVQAILLDQVEFDVTTSPRLPSVVYSQARLLDSSLKGLLIQYISGLPIIHHKSDKAIKVNLQFQPRQRTMSMKVSSPLDRTMYRNIRLPTWASNQFTISSSRPMVEQYYTSVVGTPLHSQQQPGKQPRKQLKHAVLREAGKICFSRERVPQCPHNTMAITTVEKNVEFACVSGKEAEVLEKKAHKDEQLSELRNINKSFSTSVQLPRECSRVD